VRCFVVPIAIAVAAVSSGAQAAELKTITFVHLLTDEPQGGTNALYRFGFTSDEGDFRSGTVYFNLKNGVRYGCGVHVDARCTLHAAGQTLKLIGLKNGIEGSFSWFQNAKADNRPTEISIGVPLPPAAIDHFDSFISQPGPLPEPASWAMMIGGFGLLGAQCRRARRVIAADYPCCRAG
jgi:hypothetical protein